MFFLLGNDHSIHAYDIFPKFALQCDGIINWVGNMTSNLIYMRLGSK